MPHVIKMPALSPTMEVGKIVEWVKKEGDNIASGDVMVHIETDKAIMELESVDEGVLAGIAYPAGSENVPVGVALAYLLEEGETANDIERAVPAAPDHSPQEPVSPKEDAVAAPSIEANPQADDRVFITPLARRLAQELNVNIATVVGTGPRGRIRKADIENAASALSTPSPRSETTEPISKMREVIGRRLLESKTTIPHFYVEIDIDMTNAEEAKATFKRKKRPITLHHLIMRAVALSLQDCPAVNAQKDGDTIRYLADSDVSFALGMPDGLVTPIVYKAQTKSLCEIAQEVRLLSEKGRAGRLAPREFQGGSICVTNLGMYGVKSFSAIINPPHASILSVGATRKELYMRGGHIVERSMMSCTISADHRLVDGVVAAEFLQCVREYLESPILLTI